jgi:hypothetical protein
MMDRFDRYGMIWTWIKRWIEKDRQRDRERGRETQRYCTEIQRHR